MPKKGYSKAGKIFDDDPFDPANSNLPSTPEPITSSERGVGGGGPIKGVDVFDVGTGEDDAWKQFKEQRRQDNEDSRPFKHQETEDACIRCCFFIPKLPKSKTFKRWLPKHRHILFGHFGYWVIASMTSAGSGTSLNTKCSDIEAMVLFVALIVTSLCISVPKLFSADGFKRGFGPTVLSFLIMFATGLSLHQKPLICGFPNNTRSRTRKARANAWAIVMSVQIMILILTMMCYTFWHLKHKDEKREEAQAGNDSDKESSDEDDEDSMAASPASVRWTTGQRAEV